MGLWVCVEIGRYRTPAGTGPSILCFDQSQSDILLRGQIIHKNDSIRSWLLLQDTNPLPETPLP